MAQNVQAQLARFYLRATPMRLAGVLVAVASFLVVMLFFALQAFQQSGHQNADQTNGDYDYSLVFPIDEQLGDPTGDYQTGTERALSLSGASEINAGFESFQIPLSDEPGNWVNMRGFDWSQNPFPHMYLLQEGRFPQRSNEVAVTPEVVDMLGGAKELPLAGVIRFHVVGIVENNFNRSEPLALVTGDVWDGVREVPQGQAIQGHRVALWNGGEDPQRVAANLVAEVPQLTKLGDDSQMQIAQSVSDRHKLEQDKTRIYSEVALLGALAPCVAGFIGGVFGTRFIQRIRAIVFRIGLTDAHTPGLRALFLSSIAGVILGISLGVVGGFAMRPLLDHFSNRALGPVSGVGGYGAVIVLSALVGVFIGALKLFRQVGRLRQQGERRLAHMGAYVRLAVLCAAILAGLMTSQHTDLNVRFLAPFFFGGAVVVFAPTILQLIAAVPTHSPPLLLGKRRLLSGQSKANGILLGFTAILMIGFSTLTVSNSATTSFNDEMAQLLPNDQVAIVASDDEVETSRLQQRFERSTGLNVSPIRVSLAQATGKDISGALTVVPSADDVERFLGTSLSAAEKQQLNNGAMLPMRPTKQDAVTFDRDQGSAVQIRVLQPRDGIETFDIRGVGVMTEAGAALHKLWFVPMHLVYPGLDAEQVDAVRAVADADQSLNGYVLLPEPPDVATEEPQLLLIGGAAGLLSGVLVWFFILQTLKNLRPTLASLASLGVSRRWVLLTALAESLAVIVVGVFTAAVAAGLAVYLSTLSWMTGTQMHVPWVSVTLICVAIAVIFVVALVVGMQNLQAQERFR